jgi:sugar (pentulose or hexulose) kinase
MVQLLEPVLPDAETAETYDRLYERYVALYPRLKDLPAAGA